jgi:NADH dehydrogenase FAD-containing subunit
MSSVIEADVLVLGASFAGLELVHQLRRARPGGKPSIVVVDRQASHGYLPLVHERLCDRVPHTTHELPTAEWLRRVPGTSFVQDEVIAFDPGEHTAMTAGGARLRGRVVAVGFGSSGAAPPELPGAERLHAYKEGSDYGLARAALLACLRERASPEVVVIGGGLSGVELAGELAYLTVRRPAGWAAPRVSLIAAGTRLLERMHPRVGARAQRHLVAGGVKLHLGVTLTAVEPARLLVHGGELPFDLAFWAGGVRPAAILGQLGLPTQEQGWLRVGPTLQCFPGVGDGDPEFFALGDAVRIHGGAGEWKTAQRAIEAIFQARVVARNALRLLDEPVGYAHGVPPLEPHRPWQDFPHGVSLGQRSLVAYGGLILDRPWFGRWFRRFLQRRYFARYRR